MANYIHTPHGADDAHVHPEYSTARSSSLGALTNVTGAAVSLALLVGVGVWGYKLLVRDVSGIPVVAAAKGDMRVRPADPGGQLAQHQGLSVNNITAIGSSDARADELRLAPKPVDLADEDQPMTKEDQVLTQTEKTQPEPAPAPQDANVQLAAAFEAGSIDSIVAQLTNGVAPIDASSGESVPVLASISAEDVPALLTGEGMRVSLRPTLRPKRSAATAVTPAAVAVDTDLDASTLPAGTRLVQLGAFDTPEIAREQWSQLTTRFAPFIEGKKRIVMEAKSGGRTFYRLRAHGFDDIGDARRF
ncbi:MAG: SPOR domain-containing protein, partial [Sulfitobacter sp.]